MAILASIRFPRRRQAFNWEFRERRALARLPISIRARVRIGPDLYDGQSHDVSAAGVYVQVAEPSATQYGPVQLLSMDDRGALELFSGEDRIAVRVRIARIQRRRGHAHLGLAMDEPAEAARLTQFLVRHGYITSAF